MRRLGAISVGLVAALVTAAMLHGAGAQGSTTYRVDAIFDTAKGIIPGQLVKVAGAKVGTVNDVTLTHDYKARIEMEIDERFAPFRADATCAIQPEGLLAENFVQCVPGTPSGGALTAQGGHAPTVPVSRTQVPVNLNDLFNIINMPTRQRFTILVNELGIGLSGRGEDLNALLRRANPTLALARRAIAILNRQRNQLATIVDATDTVSGDLARSRARVQDFLTQAAGVATQTADHQGALAESIRRLPPLLAATEPALRQLDRLTADGTPVLADLRASAPALTRVLNDVHPLVSATVPALKHLDPAVRTGRRAVASATPVVGQLREFASIAVPVGELLDKTLVSLRDQGFVEGLLRFTYFGTAAIARFDATSHLIGSYIFPTPCSNYSTTPVPGCSARYTDASAASTPAKAAAPKTAAVPPAAALAEALGRPAAPASAQAAPTTAGTSAAAAPAAASPNTQRLVKQLVKSIAAPRDQGALEQLGNFLLK